MSPNAMIDLQVMDMEFGTRTHYEMNRNCRNQRGCNRGKIMNQLKGVHLLTAITSSAEENCEFLLMNTFPKENS
jgi:hypothetical protein